MAELLRWRAVAGGGEAFHHALVPLPHRTRLRLHRHDFAEVFCVVKGSGNHWIAGGEQPVREGIAIFIRPDDVHGFLSGGNSPDFTIVNVAFPRRALERLRAQYASAAAAWPEKGASISHLLRPSALEWFHRASRRLSSAPRTALHRDAFLLGLLAQCEMDIEETETAALPDWLRSAMEQMRGESALVAGVPGLVRAAGRSAAHVSRTFRACLGMTAVEWLNRRRLEHATELLAATDLPVTEVAAASGFENLSHFHHCFRARYKTSPLRHRRTQRALV